MPSSLRSTRKPKKIQETRSFISDHFCSLPARTLLMACHCVAAISTLSCRYERHPPLMTMAGGGTASQGCGRRGTLSRAGG